MSRQKVLFMDNLDSQKESGFKDFLKKKCNTEPWYGPAGNTEHWQPVDRHIGKCHMWFGSIEFHSLSLSLSRGAVPHAGKTLKDMMHEYMDDKIEEYVEDCQEKVEHMPMCERRVIITHAAVYAWEKLQAEKYYQLMRAFQGPGLLIPITPTPQELAHVRPQGVPAPCLCICSLNRLRLGVAGFPEDFHDTYLSGENLGKLESSIREEMGLSAITGDNNDDELSSDSGSSSGGTVSTQGAGADKERATGDEAEALRQQEEDAVGEEEEEKAAAEEEEQEEQDSDEEEDKQPTKKRKVAEKEALPADWEGSTMADLLGLRVIVPHTEWPQWTPPEPSGWPGSIYKGRGRGARGSMPTKELIIKLDDGFQHPWPTVDILGWVTQD